jgi:hypothetical protein
MQKGVTQMKFSDQLEGFRITEGPHRSRLYEKFGAFAISKGKTTLFIIADDGKTSGWEHVSVSTDGRCPTWEEMAYVKSLFWDPEECVIEYHPPRSQYVNRHPYCLHMWRKIGFEIPLPPRELIG